MSDCHKSAASELVDDGLKNLTLAARLKAWRFKTGMSGREAAAKLELKLRTYYRFEQGMSLPPKTCIKCIERVISE